MAMSSFRSQHFIVTVSVLLGAFGLVWGWTKQPISADLPLKFTGVPSIPRPVPVRPAETKSEFQPISDNVMFDLRAWLPQDKRTAERGSPAFMSEYLVLKKVLASDVLVMHFETSGTEIQLWCPTHKSEVLVLAASESAHGVGQGSGVAGQEYALVIDTKGIEVGQVFTVLVNAVYWNSFTGETSDDAETYTWEHPESKDLILGVMLPKTKPATSIVGESGADDSKGKSSEKVDWIKYAPREDIQVGKGGDWILWNIKSSKPRTHYRLRWNW